MKKIYALFLFLLTVALAACSAAGATNEASCAPATDQLQLLTNEKHGYCLHYPAGYTAEQPTEQEVAINVGGALNVADPRVFIMVEEANGRTAAEIAEAKAAEAAPIMGEIEQTTIQIDGVEAFVLNGLPGQDIHRLVIFVHNNQLYQMMFVPVGADYGEIAERLEPFYDTIIGSFHFLP